jgi:hypothetical protein
VALGLTVLRLLARCGLLLAFLFLGGAAGVAAEAPAGAPNADTPPLHPSAAAAPSGACPHRPAPAEGAPSSIVVELDPDTLWRPRGAEVRFTIRGTAGAVVVKETRVCFAWASPDGAADEMHGAIGSTQVRSVFNPTGATEYGAVVPGLRRLPTGEWWPRRVVDTGHYVFTGAGTVPVADMIVEVTPADGPSVVIAIQVGVTNVPVALVVAVVVVLLMWSMMYSIAKHRQIAGRTLLLRIISTQDGYASLSQLQVVLWTCVVGLSAIYVMTLSGNLISIGDGTLTLLGIASGAALLARVPAATAKPAQPAPIAPPGPITPEWSDLVAPNRQTREIDVTRLQMLAFTLITAAFVAIKVVSDYEIPTIPANFLILMGISNGVYVAGRKLPATARDPAPPPG